MNDSKPASGQELDRLEKAEDRRMKVEYIAWTIAHILMAVAWGVIVYRWVS